MRSGTANLPLHGGKAPAWLFERMKRLSGAIVEHIVTEEGAESFLRKMSDPFWFQSLGCVLGFDWHSSGVTTTTCGAIKEALRERNHLGVYAAGGKGASSRKTPSEIFDYAERNRIGKDANELVNASKLIAKVDSSCVQDGYSIYHHCFLFDSNGNWTVVQQGMNENTRYARRYHWIFDGFESFVRDPHNAVCCDYKGETLNLVEGSADENRRAGVMLSRRDPDINIRELKKLQELNLPSRHGIFIQDINPNYLKRALIKTYEEQPEGFIDLLAIGGVGAKTLRALCLIGDLLYGAEASWKDPARFGFAHGGKDGIPYPVDRHSYDKTIEIMENAIKKAGKGNCVSGEEAKGAIKRLHSFYA